MLERLHGRVHRKQLHQPAEALQEHGAGEWYGRLQHGETLPPHAQELANRAHALADDGPVVPLGTQPRDRE